MSNKALALNANSDFNVLMKYADVFVQSKRFATENDVYQAAVKIQAGRELGLQPIQSMNNVVIVNGKITLGAGLISALIKSSNKYNYKIIKHDDNECELEFYELFNGEWITSGVSKFTMEDAKQAGLSVKSVWKQYPRNMLFSRAITNGARWYTPDVFGGPIYTAEEIKNGGYDTEEYVSESGLDGIEYASWDLFKQKVKAEIDSTITDNQIKEFLKSKNFSWETDKKLDMYISLQEEFGAEVIDIEYDSITE